MEEAPLEDIVRRFVMQSPPGELEAVLRNLHSLCGTDPSRKERFLRCLPEICLEYSLRYQTPIVHNESGDVLLCCRSNHLLSWVKATAKALKKQRGTSAPTGDTIGQELVEYIGRRVQEEEGTEELFDAERQFPFLFVDYVHRCYVEVDPVERKIVRRLLFDDSVKEQSATLPWVQCLQLLGGDGTVTTTDSNTAKLHKYAVKAVASYVAEHYRTDESETIGGAGPTTTAASHVIATPSNDDDSDGTTTQLTVSLSSERIHVRSRWGCRWRAVFLLCIRRGTQTIECNGEVRIEGHLYEAANVHVQLARTLDSTTVPFGPEAVAASSSSSALEKALAQQVVEVIQKAEESVQHGIESQGRELGADSLKNLRRRLPLTKQLFDFRARARQMLK